MISRLVSRDRLVADCDRADVRPPASDRRNGLLTGITG
jgi:hypothetical protein